MNIPIWFEKALRNIGGINPYGDPNLRVVWSPDERHTSGEFAGHYKYPQPDFFLKPMECWMLEVWAPPKFFGDPEDWNAELLGAFPQRGKYVLKSPLIAFKGGEPFAVDLDEGALTAIREKHFADIEWSEKNTKERMEVINEMHRQHEQAIAQRADDNAENLMDEYVRKQQQLDQEDKRVWSMPRHLEVVTKNSKMPVR